MAKCVECGWQGKWDETADDGPQWPVVCPLCGSDAVVDQSAGASDFAGSPMANAPAWGDWPPLRKPLRSIEREAACSGPASRSFKVSTSIKGARVELLKGDAIEAVRVFPWARFVEAGKLGRMWINLGPAVFVLDRHGQVPA